MEEVYIYGLGSSEKQVEMLRLDGNMAKMNRLRILVVMMVLVRVSSDLAEDQKECQEQLLGLSSCVPFISEQDKSPSPVCCIHLAKNYDDRRKCLCMMVRDRDDKGLGFKPNATRALALPFICHIKANVTHCIDFLHMDPESPDAQIFKKPYDNIFGNSSTISASSGNSESTGAGSSSAEGGKRWLNTGLVAGGLILLFPILVI